MNELPTQRQRRLRIRQCSVGLQYHRFTAPALLTFHQTPTDNRRFDELSWNLAIEEFCPFADHTDNWSANKKRRRARRLKFCARSSVKLVVFVRITKMASFLHPSFQHDDDDDRWEPLEQEEYSHGAPAVSTPCHPRSSPAGSPSRRRPTRAKDGALDLRTLQRKLETNSKLQEGLVGHPLDQAWQRFLTHLVRELWELDVRTRLGTCPRLFYCGSHFVFQSFSP
jgi:hypothetical protein